MTESDSEDDSIILRITCQARAWSVSSAVTVTRVPAMPFWLALILLCLIGFVVGGAWTVVPSLLKAYYGVNEIISVLMMSYVGINLANLLIKGPFLTTRAYVPQTDVIPFDYLLPYLPGTRIHVGIVVALAAAP